MSTTNSTKKSLNSYFGDENQTIYANHIFVNTGSMADSDGKVKNKKYVTGKVFNKTYTLKPTSGSFQETGTLLNYDDYIADDGGRIYGHPNKWVYDVDQKYNNCGVDSALNILSIAGKRDIVEPTADVISKYTAPKIVKEIDPWTGEEITKTVKPAAVDFTSTEELFTLYAIQNNYCNHSKDVSAYKSVKDIEYEDGGSYKVNISDLDHLYHDTIERIAALLTSCGVKSETTGTKILYLPELKEINPYTNEGQVVKTIDESGNEKEETIEKHEEYVVSGMQNYSIDDCEWGDSDTIVFNNLYYEDFCNQPYAIAEDGRDLVIYFTEVNYVRIINYFADPDDPKSKTTKLANIQFADQNVALRDITENFELFPHYTAELLNSNIATYGTFLTVLNDAMKAGKGIILAGSASVNYMGGGEENHAITLAGSKETDIGGETNFYSGHQLSSITDVTGLYVVDTGGWLGHGAGVTQITAEQAYNFLTGKKIMGQSRAYGVGVIWFTETEDEIKSWADDLNLYGNDRRNTLFGNRGNNVLKCGANADNLYGGEGNDTLYGGAGNDWLDGGAGSNVLYGGSGNDTYVFSREDILGSQQIINPGSGKDTLIFKEIISDDFKYYNQNGSLLIKYNENDENHCELMVKDYFSKNLYANIAKLNDQNTIQMAAEYFEQYGTDKDFGYDFLKIIQDTTISYILNENIANSVTGTKFSDVIETTRYNDTIVASSGDDTIISLTGNDVIKLGAGEDVLFNGFGNKKIYGQNGENHIVYEGGFGGYDTIYNGKGRDYIDLRSRTLDDLTFTRKGNNLVVVYDRGNGSSITVTDYFTKKGNTSVKWINLQDGYILDLVHDYQSKILPRLAENKKSKSAGDIYGGDGNDTLTGSAGDDFIRGGNGDDVINLGNGNNNAVGGLGNDKLYSGNGDNSFIYETMYDGNDTIYSSGKGAVLIRMDSIGDLQLNGTKGFVDGYHKYLMGEQNYAYSKSGNDLIIDYAKDISQEGMSSIRLANYFNSKNAYILYAGGEQIDLQYASVYFEGKQEKKNNITGSKQNDIIFGGTLNDTIKSGKGDDEIFAGTGNDVITGGTGFNRLYYSLGDGSDTINLTKNENLDIVLSGDIDRELLSYKISKNDLIIQYGDDKLFTLKNFGTKDVTGALGSVNLYHDNDYILNLRMDRYLPEFNSFSSKKTSYTGTWHSETIDASGYVKAAIQNSKGVTINGGAGNDFIIGSNYNDTLNGGSGNDEITGGNGTNTINGGNGSDTYFLFDGSIKEKTTITDTGKGAEDIDTALIFTNKENINIWFNINKAGVITTTFNVNTNDENSNKATIKGVESIQSVIDGSYSYDYNNSELRGEVTAWLTNHNFSDVNTALSSSSKGASKMLQDELVAIFNQDKYWVAN
ncbi:hypothetical protein IJ182_01540 [bacterium]|nr:hypothetical protein [bacterium]